MSDAKIPTAAELAEQRAAKAEEENGKTAPAPAVSITPSELEALKAKAAERDTFHEKWLRALADFDNYQKRARREQDRYRADALRGVLTDFILICDNLDLALQALEAKGEAEKTNAQGVRVVRDQVLSKLANWGCVPIEVAPGVPFDPSIHEAVGAIDTPGLARDEVLAVARRGFKLDNTLLRPASVMVKKAAPAAPAA